MSNLMKVCPRCNINKPISSFGNNSRTKDRLYPTCRQCVSDFQKRYTINRINPQTFLEFFVWANAMTDERFVPVVGFDTYMISDFGRLASYNPKTGRPGFKKLLFDQHGYIGSILYSENYKKRYTLHRLVALHFVDNSDNKPHVNHKLGIKYDNYYKSLEWCTASENEQHSFDVLGKKPTVGELYGGHKLFESDIHSIRERYIPYKYTYDKLADEYNVSAGCIEKVVKRKSWNHI